MTSERQMRRRTEAEEASSFLRSDLETLQSSLHQHGLVLDERASERLHQFAANLLRWNDRLNLLSRTDVENVIKKHVAASLGVFLLATPGEGDAWIDVGTGAGFPGLVLKIARPEINITLLDSARKRCLFLEDQVRTLQLGRVSVLQLRVETLLGRGEGVGAYQVVTSRAVASLSDTLANFGPLVAEGGRLITFKGPQWQEEVDQVNTSGQLQRSRFEFDRTVEVPWATGHILLFKRS
ncbi:MAG: 16S rRNA (guanine(527)-N(7))-methyltransferase RsmG [Candidatus Eisenbacteria bacterium]|nr:16S rRNA (guanine(527)-N(7))-methyltransferase RsmG [Candidatus Eisenbacteria bacterium]